MIKKKFVAIVLAVGLIVSIGYAVSQPRFINQQSGILGSPDQQIIQPFVGLDQAGFIIDGGKQQITQPIIKPEIAPTILVETPPTQNQLGSTPQGSSAETYATPIIDSYRVDLITPTGTTLLFGDPNATVEEVKATIDCYSKVNEDYIKIGEIHFLPENAPLLTNRLYNSSQTGYVTRVVLYFPISRISEVLAVLNTGNANIALQLPTGIGVIGASATQH